MLSTPGIGHGYTNNINITDNFNLIYETYFLLSPTLLYLKANAG